MSPLGMGLMAMFTSKVLPAVERSELCLWKLAFSIHQCEWILTQFNCCTFWKYKPFYRRGGIKGIRVLPPDSFWFFFTLQSRQRNSVFALWIMLRGSAASCDQLNKYLCESERASENALLLDLSSYASAMDGWTSLVDPNSFKMLGAIFEWHKFRYFGIRFQRKTKMKATLYYGENWALAGSKEQEG